MGVVFESLTLLTKYYPQMIEAYLISVAFTGPALLISMGKLEDLDDDIRIFRMRREARSAQITLRTESSLLKASVPIKKELATLRAEDNIADRRNGKLISKSKGWYAWFKINRLAREDMTIVYRNIRTKEQKREVDKLKKGASEAKVISTTAKRRKSRGPRPETAANGIYCKADGCDNKLREGQKKYCSQKCGNRERARSLRAKN